MGVLLVLMNLYWPVIWFGLVLPSCVLQAHRRIQRRTRLLEIPARFHRCRLLRSFRLRHRFRQ